MIAAIFEDDGEVGAVHPSPPIGKVPPLWPARRGAGRAREQLAYLRGYAVMLFRDISDHPGGGGKIERIP
jgi:hypothetical protein